MTAQEVYTAVLFELKHYNTTTMTPREFNHHAFVGQLEYVDLRFWAHDQHQKQIDDLTPIKDVTDGIAGSLAPLVNLGDNVAGREWFQLPENFLRLLNVGVQLRIYGDPCIEDGTLQEGYQEADYLTDDRALAVKGDHYSKPSHEKNHTYYTQRGANKILIQAGASIAETLCVTYYRYPTRMLLDENTGATVQSSELGDRQLLEVAKWITHSYLETIQEMRMQSMAMILGKNFDQFPPVNQLT